MTNPTNTKKYHGDFDIESEHGNLSSDQKETWAKQVDKVFICIIAISGGLMLLKELFS